MEIDAQFALEKEKAAYQQTLDLKDKEIEAQRQAEIETQKHKLAVMEWKRCTETCILEVEVGVQVTAVVGIDHKCRPLMVVWNLDVFHQLGQLIVNGSVYLKAFL
ncbi:unnamed protein product [Caretta caretta]